MSLRSRRSKKYLLRLHVYWSLPGDSETRQRHVGIARYRYPPTQSTPLRSSLQLSPFSAACGGLRGSDVLVVAVLVDTVSAVAAYYFDHSQFESLGHSLLNIMYS